MFVRVPVWGGFALFCFSCLCGTISAQVPEFRAQSGLLSQAGLSTPSFRSGTPMGVADLNGDGRDDIIRVASGLSGVPDQLSLEFQDAPGGAFGHLFLGQIYEEWAASICVADVDGNGVNDILLGGYDISGGNDEGSQVLYRGDISGTLWTMDPVPVRDGDLLVQGTIFSDLDNDGAIDVFACDDIDNPEKFFNDGLGNLTWDASDMIFPTGLPFSIPDSNEGNYAVVATDFDSDGDLDYYLSKCRSGEGSSASLRRINRLFINDGGSPPGYTETAGAHGLDDGNQSWCANFGDIDNDGDLDCFVLNHQLVSGHPSGPSGSSILYLNDGSGNFSDSTSAAGLAGEVNFIGLQSLFRDFNNDGFLDLLVTSMEFSPADYGYYQNDGDGSFTAYGPADGIFTMSDGTPLDRVHSMAVGDLNHDGFLDVYAGRGRGLNYPASPDLLCFNRAPHLGNTHGYLSVTLVGASSNPNGIGARIEAHGPFAQGGGQGVQLREVCSGEGYGIMNSLNAHFGLGAAVQVDQLVVRWPSGAVDTIGGVPGDRCVSIFEGTDAVAMDYADWIGDFYPAGGMDAEPDGDPDGDRMKNAVEQLLGRNPKVHDAVNALETTMAEDGGQAFLVIEVDRVPTRNLRLGVEVTEDPSDSGSWAEDPAMEVLEDGPMRYAVRIPVGSPGPTRLFARLVVSVE